MTESTKTEVGSYFISNYPPFSQWSKEAVSEIEAAMAAPPADTPLGLYLHLPFCRKRCKFCYFKVFTDKNAKEVERYLAALSKEIELVSQLPVMGDRPFRFVYFGGGTPSYLSSRQLHRLVDRLRANIDWSKAEEVTFECEPGTLSEAKVGTLKEIGVTRLSLGVEHFDDAILRDNGRAHESMEIDRAWPWIKAAQFDNVNIDLIAGMKGDTTEKWEATVQRAIELDPDCVTIYQMELPFNTVISQGVLAGEESPIASWEQKREWVSWAFDKLAEAGYETSSAYTMVKPGVKFSYRDNLWRGSDLLATGIASFGHASGVHYQNLPEWEQYLGKLEAGELPLGRALTITAHQALVREMVLQLKKGWLEAGYFREKFGVDIIDHWRDQWTGHRDEGLLGFTDERVELTRDGLLRVDSLLPVFFEPEHQNVRYT
ncbi:Oxygen-independent coproporphyrinogen-III oxidase 1 [Pseudobythopirellula maris]|uniref:Oxygen-independent coproporphyrinogen-III oxidase 1 n=1 Tax=Pseudobythopirellula maris TaxID=2527991 RepID=A0A5C5ZKL5_9BACT|nr:coproporphyrinogen-III oxidase family protein [Pseudobythopirellula maris]TWT87341.1 Oxygen-independent coproporphyrinogen-III oxidase 1 [Pseudobythopirellula maris]